MHRLVARAGGVGRAQRGAAGQAKRAERQVPAHATPVDRMRRAAAAVLDARFSRVTIGAPRTPGQAPQERRATLDHEIHVRRIRRAEQRLRRIHAGREVGV